MIAKFIKKYAEYLILFFCLVVLVLTLRGVAGNPTAKELLSDSWRSNGPFELSPESGRFALTYSLVEDKSVFFSPDIARFTLPDVGTRDGKYVSLFAPALSFIVMPGYFIGKFFGASQVGAFASVSIFALLNVFMIGKIARNLGANKISSVLGGILFLFATPAFAYGVNLYQHHVATFTILLSLYLLLFHRNWWSSFVVFFLFAFGVALDYPNFFMMLPLIMAIVFGRILKAKSDAGKLSLKINLMHAFMAVGVVLPVLFFFWFNANSYGGPLRLLGGSAVTSVREIDSQGKPIVKLRKPIELAKGEASLEGKIGGLAHFDTRNLLNGFYIHTISPDRGVLVFAPLVIFGIIGLLISIAKDAGKVRLLLGVIGMNVLLYSLWGDPWGGWAFGSRYLIPTYAVLSIFLALLITKWGRKIIFLLALATVSIYSVAVNLVGALSTIAVPPKIQVLELEKLSGVVQKYNYERGWDLLVNYHTKSIFYNTFLEFKITPVQYYFILLFVISIAIISICTVIYIKKND